MKFLSISLKSKQYSSPWFIRSLKLLDRKCERSLFNTNCLENHKSTNFDVKDIAYYFCAYFSNLVENPVRKLPNLSSQYRLVWVAQYIHLRLTNKFDLLAVEKESTHKILKDIDNTKATGIDRLPGTFTKDGADVLVKPVTGICDLSISLNKFPKAFKLAKFKPISKKDWRFQITDRSPYYSYFRRSLSKFFTNKQLSFYMIATLRQSSFIKKIGL